MIQMIEKIVLTKFNIRGTDDSAKDSVIRTRSGRVSKPTRFKDFVYY